MATNSALASVRARLESLYGDRPIHKSELQKLFSHWPTHVIDNLHVAIGDYGNMYMSAGEFVKWIEANEYHVQDRKSSPRTANTLPMDEVRNEIDQLRRNLLGEIDMLRNEMKRLREDFEYVRRGHASERNASTPPKDINATGAALSEELESPSVSSWVEVGAAPVEENPGSVLPPLLLHFDVENTILFSENGHMETIEEIVRESISELFWGLCKDDGGRLVWTWTKTKPSCYPPDGFEDCVFGDCQLVNYAQYCKKAMKDKASRKAAAKPWGLVTDLNTRAEMDNLFKSSLERLELYSEVRYTREATEAGLSGSNLNMFPAIFALVAFLERSRRKFSVLFRTFGDDYKKILLEWNAFCEMRHPIFSQLLEGVGPLDGSVPGVPDRRIVVEGGMHTLYRDAYGPVLILSTFTNGPPGANSWDSWAKQKPTPKQDLRNGRAFISDLHTNSVDGMVAFRIWIQNHTLAEKTSVIKDDWAWWHWNGEQAHAGKLLTITEGHSMIKQIFFDDSIEYQDARLVDCRYANGDCLPLKLAQDKMIIKVNPVEAVNDEDFFIKMIQRLHGDHHNEGYAVAFQEFDQALHRSLTSGCESPDNTPLGTCTGLGDIFDNPKRLSLLFCYVHLLPLKARNRYGRRLIRTPISEGNVLRGGGGDGIAIAGVYGNAAELMLRRALIHKQHFQYAMLPMASNRQGGSDERYSVVIELCLQILEKTAMAMQKNKRRSIGVLEIGSLLPYELQNAWSFLRSSLVGDRGRILQVSGERAIGEVRFINQGMQSFFAARELYRMRSCADLPSLEALLTEPWWAQMLNFLAEAFPETYVEVIEQRLKHFESSNGNTFLHLAASVRHEPVFHLLGLFSFQNQLALGSKILSTGQTPLHVAAGKGNDSLCLAMIEQNVSIDIEDGDGRWALHLAMQEGHFQTARLIADEWLRLMPEMKNQGFDHKLCFGLASLILSSDHKAISEHDFLHSLKSMFLELRYFDKTGDRVEKKRVLGAVLAVYWMVTNQYDKFVRSQPVESRLSEHSWEEVQKWMRTNLRLTENAAAVHAMLVLDVITGVGRIKAFRTAFASNCQESGEALAQVLEQFPFVFPSYAKLDASWQRVVLACLKAGDFNIGQFLQAENVPANLLTLKQLVHVRPEGQFAELDFSDQLMNSLRHMPLYDLIVPGTVPPTKLRDVGSSFPLPNGQEWMAISGQDWVIIDVKENQTGESLKVAPDLELQTGNCVTFISAEYGTVRGYLPFNEELKESHDLVSELSVGDHLPTDLVICRTDYIHKSTSGKICIAGDNRYTVGKGSKLIAKETSRDGQNLRGISEYTFEYRPLDRLRHNFGILLPCARTCTFDLFQFKFLTDKSSYRRLGMRGEGVPGLDMRAKYGLNILGLIRFDGKSPQLTWSPGQAEQVGVGDLCVTTSVGDVCRRFKDLSEIFGSHTRVNFTTQTDVVEQLSASMCREMDTDHNGVISRNEYSNYMGKHKLEMDTDRNHKVSGKELYAFVESQARLESMRSELKLQDVEHGASSILGFFLFKLFAEMCGILGMITLEGSKFMVENMYAKFKVGLESLHYLQRENPQQVYNRFLEERSRTQGIDFDSSLLKTAFRGSSSGESRAIARLACMSRVFDSVGGFEVSQAFQSLDSNERERLLMFINADGIDVKPAICLLNAPTLLENGRKNARVGLTHAFRTLLRIFERTANQYRGADSQVVVIMVDDMVPIITACSNPGILDSIAIDIAPVVWPGSDSHGKVVVKEIRKEGAESVTRETQTKEEPQPQREVCINCGNKFLDDALFCRKCGTKRPEALKTVSDLQKELDIANQERDDTAKRLQRQLDEATENTTHMQRTLHSAKREHEESAKKLQHELDEALHHISNLHDAPKRLQRELDEALKNVAKLKEELETATAGRGDEAKRLQRELNEALKNVVELKKELETVTVERGDEAKRLQRELDEALKNVAKLKEELETATAGRGDEAKRLQRELDEALKNVVKLRSELAREKKVNEQLQRSFDEASERHQGEAENETGKTLQNKLNKLTRMIDDLKVCIECGNKFLDDAVFCRKCGTKRPERPEASKDKAAEDAGIIHEDEEEAGITFLVGDLVKAKPGATLTLDGVHYFSEGHEGVVSSVDANQYSIAWEQTGKTSTMTKSAWIKYVEKTGKKATEQVVEFTYNKDGGSFAHQVMAAVKANKIKPMTNLMKFETILSTGEVLHTTAEDLKVRFPNPDDLHLRENSPVKVTLRVKKAGDARKSMDANFKETGAYADGRTKEELRQVRNKALRQVKSAGDAFRKFGADQ